MGETVARALGKRSSIRRRASCQDAGGQLRCSSRAITASGGPLLTPKPDPSINFTIAVRKRTSREVRNRAMSHTLLEDRLILLAVRAGPFVQPVDGDRVGWLCPSKTVNERMFLRPTANNFWRLGG